MINHFIQNKQNNRHTIIFALRTKISTNTRLLNLLDHYNSFAFNISFNFLVCRIEKLKMYLNNI